MRTRFLSKMTNNEAEAYLEKNDIIIVPVGTTEVHGGLPLDSETVLAEALAIKLAEACDGLVLHNLPYFYAGSTIRGRGTVQVGVQDSITYLTEISKSLLRQGFRRQIFISAHAPSYLYISPVVREMFDRYQAPILYMDPIRQIGETGKGFLDIMRESDSEDVFTEIILGGYDIMGRLEDVPLTTPDNDFWTERKGPSTAFANKLTGLAHHSGAMGLIFADNMDHMPTIKIESEAHRQELADKGRVIIEQMVVDYDMPSIVGKMNEVDDFVQEQAAKYEWVNPLD